MGRRNQITWLACLLTLVILTAAGGLSNALAQEADKKQEGKPDFSQKSVKIFLDKIEVIGQISKPQAVFIIPGSDPTVDDIKLDRSFFQEIFRKVERDDFRHRKRRARGGHIPW